MEERCTSVGSLTDSAYGTESQYSSETASIGRSDSCDTLLTDSLSGTLSPTASLADSRDSFLSDSCSDDTFSQRAAPKAVADTLEVETRGGHKHKMEDEDEDHDQSVTFKVSKRTGAVTAEIDDGKKYWKKSESSEGDQVSKEGARSDSAEEIIGGELCQVDTMTQYKTRDDQSCDQAIGRTMKERSKEVIGPDSKVKITSEKATSDEHFKGTSAVGRSEDKDLTITKSDGTSQVMTIKSDEMDTSEHTQDEVFQETTKAKEQDDQLAGRESLTDFATEDCLVMEHQDSMDILEEDGHQTSTENLLKQKTKTKKKKVPTATLR